MVLYLIGHILFPLLSFIDKFIELYIGNTFYLFLANKLQIFYRNKLSTTAANTGSKQKVARSGSYSEAQTRRTSVGSMHRQHSINSIQYESATENMSPSQTAGLSGTSLHVPK